MIPKIPSTSGSCAITRWPPKNVILRSVSHIFHHFIDLDFVESLDYLVGARDRRDLLPEIHYSAIGQNNDTTQTPK